MNRQQAELVLNPNANSNYTSKQSSATTDLPFFPSDELINNFRHEASDESSLYKGGH